MNKLLLIVALLALGASVCGMLKADDPAAAPLAGVRQGPGPDSLQANNEYASFVEHNAEIAKDAEATGVEGVIYAAALLRDKEPQVQIDFFTKALHDSKLRPVQREIRFALFQIYRQQGQNDKALDQLRQLMMDQ